MVRHWKRREFGIFYTSLFVLCILIALNSGCRLFSPSGTGGNPLVTIVSPVDGDTIRESYHIIKAEVASSERILKIRFFDNNLFLGEVQEEPFEHLWETAYVSNGEHTLKAEVVDHSGNTGYSPSVSVIVSKTLYDWNLASTPVDYNLNSLFAINSSNIWVCGDSGTILSYDGSDWTVSQIATSTSEELFDLFFDSPDRGWCVGKNVLLEYSSGVWEQLQTFTKEELLSIYISNNGDSGWVGNAEGELFVYADKSLSLYGILDTMEISDIYGTSFSDVWACCGNSIYHYDGMGWSQDTLFTGERIYTLFSLDGIIIWAGGTNLYCYNGTYWERSALPIQGGTITALHFIDLVSGVACGNNGTGGFILSYDGEVWREETVQSTNRELYGVCVFSSGEGWAVGNGGTVLFRAGN
jgi:hypothetical protein